MVKNTGNTHMTTEMFNHLGKKNQNRYPSFFNEKGEPKKIRMYSSLGTENQTADCYTIVLTGSYRKKTGGQFWVACCGQTVFHPLGIGFHEEYDHQIDRPKYSHLGKKINFETLSDDAKKYVLSLYCYLWDFADDDFKLI